MKKNQEIEPTHHSCASTASKRIIYFDNNATTVMPKTVIEEIIKWTNMGNPSSDYSTAMRCRNLIQSFRDYIASKSNFKLSTDEIDIKAVKPTHFRIVITSCASESNALIIRSVVDSYHKNVGSIPHIVSTSIEHKSIIDTLNQLQSENRITLTTVAPDPLGFITSKIIAGALQPHTALCICMYANNETGVINNIKEIARVSHSNNTPFFTDGAQIYGKYGIDPVADDIDAFSVSFHKIYGPIGIGMLVIKEEFLRGYKLHGQIGGTQNDGFRGGTMNTPGIAGAFAGMKYASERRSAKNENLRAIKRYIIEQISKRIPSKLYREFLIDEQKPTPKPAMEVVFISSAEKTYLPGTLLLSVVKRTAPDMCNGELKKHLCSNGIIVSIGSACNTDSDKASHVLKSMNAPRIIQRGTIRLSLNDEATFDDADIFIKNFIEYINVLNLEKV